MNPRSMQHRAHACSPSDVPAVLLHDSRSIAPSQEQCASAPPSQLDPLKLASWQQEEQSSPDAVLVEQTVALSSVSG
jgi:hypothetical protein